MKKAIIGSAIGVVLVVVIGLNIRSARSRAARVHVARAERGDVTEIITASGTIQPRRRVNVSASAMGRITRLAVEEGDVVHEGDFLLEIDPKPYESTVAQLEAAVRGAAATLEVEEASFEKARRDFERVRDLHAKGFASDQELRDAEAAFAMARARLQAARETLSQQRANLAKARHDLDQVRITASMSGVVTALNVEEGETAIIGTMNNPGTVLLTISDLSEMEAEVLVDETEVVRIRPGQRSRVHLDAYPDTTFEGVVREVGSSALRQQVGLGQESVDFKVVVSIRDSIPDIRPGLSASVDITVAEAHDVVTVPIQCLTARTREQLERARGRGRSRRAPTDSTAGAAPADAPTSARSDAGERRRPVEGVFVVADGRVEFRPVRVGISGERVVEIRSGLGEGETVVSGPFRVLKELRPGARVRVVKSKRRGDSAGGDASS